MSAVINNIAVILSRRGGYGLGDTARGRGDNVSSTVSCHGVRYHKTRSHFGDLGHMGASETIIPSPRWNYGAPVIYSGVKSIRTARLAESSSVVRIGMAYHGHCNTGSKATLWDLL